MHALLRVVVKEFQQLRQDRKMLPVLFIGPLFQLIALGFAANLDVTHIPIVVVDQDRTPSSRAFVERFTGSAYFTMVGSEERPDAIEPWLVDGRAKLGLVVGPRFGASVAGGKSARVQVIVDGTDANTAMVGMGYAAQIASAFGAEIVAERSSTLVQERTIGSADLRPRVWFNPDLKSRWFYVPAILAMVLMLVTMILPSMAVVREKEIGTLEQLIVTPLQPWQLILGKLLPFVLIGVVDTAVIAVVAQLVLGVPLRGSFVLLVALTILFLMNTLGLGLLVSSMVSTQQQAMMACIYLFMVPMIYLSGLLFPIDNMPVAFQWVSYAIPVRYYANILRGIFLKASGPSALWPDAAALGFLGTVILTLAASRFRRTLD